MTVLTPFEVRRRLLRMSTLDKIIIGRLTVRLFVTTATTRWEITSKQVRQVYSYPRRVDYDWLEGGANYLSLSNVALKKATAYILANYQGERVHDNGLCPVCGDPLTSRRQTYCSSVCRISAYQRRRRTA